MKTVIKRTGGRLGNVMFNVVSGAYFAKQIGAEYLVEYSPNHCNMGVYLDNIFQNFKTVEYDYYRRFPNAVVVNEINPMIYTKVEDVDSDIIVIEGCRQSPLYWNNDKQFAVDLFKTDIDDKIIDTIRNEYPDIENCISVNVRLGDYRYAKSVIGLLDSQWYINALRHFDENEKVIVISDEVEECKRMFQGKNFLYADKKFPGIDFPAPLIDLYMQKLTKGNVIANSTFSWWAAYLNEREGRKVVCPYEWGHFAKESKDYIPENDNWEIEKAIWS